MCHPNGRQSYSPPLTRKQPAQFVGMRKDQKKFLMSIFVAHKPWYCSSASTTFDSEGSLNVGITPGVREFMKRKSAIRLHFSDVLGTKKHLQLGGKEVEGLSKKLSLANVDSMVVVGIDSLVGCGRTLPLKMSLSMVGTTESHMC